VLRRPGDVFYANPKEIPALLERGLVAEHPEPEPVETPDDDGEPDTSGDAPGLVDLSASTATPEPDAAAAASTEP
jgi:hypothetical protein